METSKMRGLRSFCYAVSVLLVPVMCAMAQQETRPARVHFIDGGFTPQAVKIPTLFIVGDSTVKNGTKGMVGWGEVLAKHFDKNKIKVENHAIAGRSSRTFQTEGR